MKIDKKYQFDRFFKKTKKNNVRKIDYIVLHNVETDCVKTAIEMFKEHEVSAHYIIDMKGNIFLLVDDNDISYHSGLSYWKGQKSLNKNSIGIEFVNSDVENKKFTNKQLKSGVELCKNLIKKHKIDKKNILAHSDIGYYGKSSLDVNAIKLDGLLDRKQDPSHQFDWRFFYKNDLGIYPQKTFRGKDRILFRFGDKYQEISEIKKKLAQFGYKVKSKNDVFDLEMRLLTRVFNRRFNQKKYRENPDIWWKSSDYYLNQIVYND